MNIMLPKVKSSERSIELPVALFGEQSGAASTLAFELNRGLTYQVLPHSLNNKNFLLQRIASLPAAALIAFDGGLISNLTAQENMLLPIQYHSVSSDKLALQNALSVLKRFELNHDEILRLFRAMPSHLSLFEKRLIGFARTMIVEPEIMVCDNIFEGLTENEIAVISRFGEIFHLYFPFRTVIFLELDHARGIIHADKTFHLH